MPFDIEPKEEPNQPQAACPNCGLACELQTRSPRCTFSVAIASHENFNELLSKGWAPGMGVHYAVCGACGSAGVAPFGPGYYEKDYTDKELYSLSTRNAGYLKYLFGEIEIRLPSFRCNHTKGENDAD